MATKIREGTQTPEGWYKKLGATTTEEESWHFKVGDPACQETDWDGRRSRALLTAQADDRNDIVKYTLCYKECYLRVKRQIGTEGALGRC
jgi:hypothetical protein